MNFKFENDIEKNIMRLTVDILPRKKVNEQRIRVRWPDIDKLIKENYSTPQGYDLGQPLTNVHHTQLDSDFKEKCSATWEFMLVKNKPAVKKTTKAKTKTTRRKR